MTDSQRVAQFLEALDELELACGASAELARDLRRHLRAQVERLTTVAETAARFEQKLARLQPAIDGAFAVQQLHGFRYTGETYAEELTALRTALARCKGEPVEPTDAGPRGNA